VALLQFTPDGQALLAGTDEPMGPTGIAYAEVFRVASGARVADLGLQNVPLRSAGGALVAHSFGGSGCKMLTRELTLVDAPFAGDEDEMNLVFSDDGQWVARADGILARVDGASTLQLERAEGATPLAFDPTASWLLGKGEDGAALIWRVESGKRLM
jgi:hypothetical protein